MEVELHEVTPDPEMVVANAARNDVLSEWVGDMEWNEVLDGVEPADHRDFFEKTPYKRGIAAQLWTLLGEHLLGYGHFGPFEHPNFTFHIKGVSRSLMAQITRHRTGISFDIQSMRYVKFDEIEPEPGEGVIAIPELENPGISGQGAEFADEYEGLDDDLVLDTREEVYARAIKSAFTAYDKLLDLGVAPENARMVLPIGTKVNITMTVNARTLMHITDMRAAGDAQWEIQELTEELLEIAQKYMPVTFKYYEENLHGRKNRIAP